MAAVIIFGAIILLLVLWVVAVQRKLVSSEELVKNSMSQIGVQQSSRWDALGALVELVKSYNEHEYNTLKDVIASRRDIDGNSSIQDVEAQEQAISGAVRQIKILAENYPDLKANENYAKLIDNVNLYENQVRLSRMTYNDTVTKFNRIVRQLPDSIIASLFGFSEKDYLKEEKGKTDMPSMKI